MREVKIFNTEDYFDTGEKIKEFVSSKISDGEGRQIDGLAVIVEVVKLTT